jgi:preprotein translocase subunit YajC
MLTSGIFGRVSAIDEDSAKIHVEIAPGVIIEVARVAIATVIPESTDDEADDTAATEVTDEAVGTD